MVTEATRPSAFTDSGQEVPGSVTRSTAEVLVSLLMSGIKLDAASADDLSNAATTARQNSRCDAAR